MSLVAPSAVSRKLPLTVAMAGRASVYTFTYGCAADHGGHTAPPCPAEASAVIRATSGGRSVGGASSISTCAGSVSHESCCSSVYASARTTRRQLSIAPVGQGEMQSLQPLQMDGSTT